MEGDLCAGQEALMLIDTVRVEQSAVIRGDVDRVWSLLSSPDAWSLRSAARYMFTVPDAPQLRFHLAATGRGISSDVFEVCEEEPGKSLSLQSQGPLPQFVTFAVTPARRGATRASIAISQSISPVQAADLKRAMRAGVNAWLGALRAAIENRAPWPSGSMPAELHQSCMSLPRVTNHVTVSAAILICADPDAVWQAISSPHAHGPHPGGAVHAGLIPGTPQGQPGEIQYGIYSRPDGSLRGCAVAVTEIHTGREALTHRVGPPHNQTRYLLTPEGGHTRLEIVWRGPDLRAEDDPAKSLMAEHLQSVLGEHKARIEESAGPQDSIPS
jgi:uncharacterized protein YndB with AHSA1/START domain